MSCFITVGAGKGGVGKSLVSAALASALARNAPVLLVDLDLGGCNLHSWLGISPFSPETLSSFFTDKRPVGALVKPTEVQGLFFLQGPTQFLTAPNLKYAQKKRIILGLRKLPYPWIIADLGAGSHYNVVDFFLMGQLGILVLTPERTSIENAYRFLKVALLRLLFSTASTPETARMMEDWSHRLARTPLKELLHSPPYDIPWFTEQVQGIRLALILNQIQEEDEKLLGERISRLVEEYLLLPTFYLGAIPYLPRVRQILREPSPPAVSLLEEPLFRDPLLKIAAGIQALLRAEAVNHELTV